MKRSLIYLLFLLLTGYSSCAQKLTLGSEIPSIKSMKEDVVWLNGRPEDDKYKIFEFYQPINKSCVSNLERLKKIIKNRRDNLDIILLTRESGQNIHELAKSLKGDIYVGIDTTDNGYFLKCNVKYLPYSLLIDSKNKLLWHGFLYTLSEDALDEKLLGNGD